MVNAAADRPADKWKLQPYARTRPHHAEEADCDQQDCTEEIREGKIRGRAGEGEITAVSSESTRLPGEAWSRSFRIPRPRRLILLLPLMFRWASADETQLAPPAPLKPHPAAVPNTHPPGEVDKPELVRFIVKHPTLLPGIVVDETEAVLVGKWQYSTHTPPYVGVGYLHDQKADKGEKSVTFTPRLPAAGVYEVRMSHCYNIRRATNTPVVIHHADGDTQLRLNQQDIPPHGRLFRTLGRFRFEAGRHGWVRISTNGTDGKYVIADAMQFIPVNAAEK